MFSPDMIQGGYIWQEYHRILLCSHCIQTDGGVSTFPILMKLILITSLRWSLLHLFTVKLLLFPPCNLLLHKVIKSLRNYFVLFVCVCVFSVELGFELCFTLAKQVFSCLSHTSNPFCSGYF
jgi:hypothetical protein